MWVCEVGGGSTPASVGFGHGSFPQVVARYYIDPTAKKKVQKPWNGVCGFVDGYISLGEDENIEPASSQKAVPKAAPKRREGGGKAAKNAAGSGAPKAKAVPKRQARSKSKPTPKAKSKKQSKAAQPKAKAKAKAAAKKKEEQKTEGKEGLGNMSVKQS